MAASWLSGVRSSRARGTRTTGMVAAIALLSGCGSSAAVTAPVSTAPASTTPTRTPSATSSASTPSTPAPSGSPTSSTPIATPAPGQPLVATTRRPAGNLTDMPWQPAASVGGAGRTLHIRTYFGGCHGAPVAAWVQQDAATVRLHVLDVVTHPSRGQACSLARVMTPVDIVLPSPLAHRTLLGAGQS